MPICHICGHRLISAGTGKPVPGVPIIVDGIELRAHKCCAESAGFLRQKPKGGRLPRAERWKGEPQG